MGLGLDLGFAFTNDGKSLAENRDCGFVFSCSGVVQGVLGSKKKNLSPGTRSVFEQH